VGVLARAVKLNSPGIAAFISTVTKYNSSYVAVPFLFKIFLLQNKAILQKIVLRYYFAQSSTP
jgi:hypothetical protein